MIDKFEEHFQKVVALECGFRMVKNPREATETYAGIYRKEHPNWKGWRYIDKGEIPPTDLVRNFYYKNYYKPLEAIKTDNIRFSIFEFAVNARFSKAVKITQAVAGVIPDGIIGPKTLAALNDIDEEDFIKSYTIARIKHYLDIVNRNPKRYGIYLRGWLNRIFKGLTV